MELKNLFCIEYPGKIQNEQRMIDTLGGINRISNAFAHNRKLECKFRPEDKFCKGTFGEKSKTSNFLLKITIKKTKIKKKNGTYEEKIQCIPTIIGRVKQVFKFRNLSDFQYLPIEKDENGKLISLHDRIIPKRMEPISWLEEPMNSFLPPVCFARIDNVQPYLTTKTTDTPGNVIGRTRDRRSNYVKFVNFDCAEVPDSPNPNTLRYIKLKLVDEEQIIKMKNLFDTRPVWTRNALSYVTQFSVVQLKYLLALGAYHFTSGPFRIAWVRFGYDPRKDPTARQYQIIDYRTRGKVLQLLEERFPNKYLPRSSIKNKLASRETIQSKDPIDDRVYIFKPGYMPTHRQMFYQLCDIHIPEIQQKLENLPESEYDVKTGWITEEFSDEVRKAIDKCVLETLTSSCDDEVTTKKSSVFVGNEAVNTENRLIDDDFSTSEEELDYEDDEDLSNALG